MTTFRLCLALLMLVLPLPANALEGWRAQDDDSIMSPQGERVRLIGVDTAELNCKCERQCTMADKALVFTRTKLKEAERIELIRFPPDKYGRTLARVYLDGQDLSAMLIEAKLGRPYNGGRRLSWCL